MTAIFELALATLCQSSPVETVTPWFEPNRFGAIFGGVVGGVGGSLLGCLGGMSGYFVQRGKARGVVIGGYWLFFYFGVLNLLCGLTALAMGQPYGIWYPLILVGVILGTVAGALIPVMKAQYGAAELRLMAAKDFGGAV